MRTLLLVLLSLAAVALVGCSRDGGGPGWVAYEQAKDFDARSGAGWTVPYLLNEQRARRFTVSVESEGLPLNVYACLPEHLDEVREAALTERPPASPLLGKAERVEKASFEVSVPARAELSVYVFNPGKRDGKVRFRLTAVD